jgi:flagellar operon protein (TIGR03826 family)
MMTLSNCSNCGRIFDKRIRDICPACIEEEEKDFLQIKDYLNDHPTAGIKEISEETGITERRGISFFKNGRLLASRRNREHKLLSCERCGEPIAYGKFCERCQQVLSKTLRSGGAPKDNRNRPERQESQPARGEHGQLTEYFHK